MNKRYEFVLGQPRTRTPSHTKRTGISSRTKEAIFRNHIESACTECGLADDVLITCLMNVYTIYSALITSKPGIHIPSKNAMDYAIDTLEERKADFVCEDNAGLLHSAFIEMLDDGITFLKQVNEGR